jgi:hypothetical protein
VFITNITDEFILRYVKNTVTEIIWFTSLQKRI